MHLFISYAKKDTRDLALALTDALNALEGITAWVDKTLRAGKSWELQIQSEIDRCDAMIVLYSPDINRHKLGQDESYVLTEIHYAKRIAKKRIIPVMAVLTDPPMSLALEHYIDFTLAGLALSDLVDALCGELGIAAVVVNQPPVVDVPEPPFIPSAPRSSATLDEDLLEDARVPDWLRGVPASHETLGEDESEEPDIPDWLSGASVSDETLQEAIERARTFKGKRNRDWTPFITTFKDLEIPNMPFCLVPVGSFQMGANDPRDDTKPIHPQTISKPYYLAQYPVTNAQWALGVKAGVVKEPGTKLDWYRDAAMADAPVVEVLWREAEIFSNWLGCRLPTEVEWEYAARGVESLVYPWGNDWKPDYCVWSGNSGGKPASVQSKPEGASWVGARHLSGNVYDWVSTAYALYPYRANDGREDVNRTDVQRVLRGGSWDTFNSSGVRAASRGWAAPNFEYNLRGFRPVRSLA